MPLGWEWRRNAASRTTAPVLKLGRTPAYEEGDRSGLSVGGDRRESEYPTGRQNVRWSGLSQCRSGQRRCEQPCTVARERQCRRVSDIHDRSGDVRHNRWCGGSAVRRFHSVHRTELEAGTQVGLAGRDERLRASELDAFAAQPRRRPAHIARVGGTPASKVGFGNAMECLPRPYGNTAPRSAFAA